MNNKSNNSISNINSNKGAKSATKANPRIKQALSAKQLEQQAKFKKQKEYGALVRELFAPVVTPSKPAATTSTTKAPGKTPAAFPSSPLHASNDNRTAATSVLTPARTQTGTAAQRAIGSAKRPTGARNTIFAVRIFVTTSSCFSLPPSLPPFAHSPLFSLDSARRACCSRP